MYPLSVDEGNRRRRERDNSWRKTNARNVSYCLYYGVHYPHQHSVDTPSGLSLYGLLCHRIICGNLTTLLITQQRVRRAPRIFPPTPRLLERLSWHHLGSIPPLYRVRPSFLPERLRGGAQAHFPESAAGTEPKHHRTEWFSIAAAENNWAQCKYKTCSSCRSIKLDKMQRALFIAERVSPGGGQKRPAFSLYWPLTCRTWPSLTPVTDIPVSFSLRGMWALWISRNYICVLSLSCVHM